MYVRSTALAAVCTVLLAACGESDDTASAPAETVTVVTTTVAAAPEPAPVRTVTERAAATPAPKPRPKPKPKPKPAARNCTSVPSVVGEDHQLAQDTMQAAGFYALEEEDATGQGRLLILDRNWTVVSQSPSGGACASEDATITLRSKKDGE